MQDVNMWLDMSRGAKVRLSAAIAPHKPSAPHSACTSSATHRRSAPHSTCTLLFECTRCTHEYLHCARAAGAGLALGTCPGRACRRRASSRRSRARGRYIARAHGPTRRRAAQRSAHACARSSSASCCWMDPMALQPRRLAEFRQWVGEGPSQNHRPCFSFTADAFRLLHEGSLSKSAACTHR